MSGARTNFCAGPDILDRVNVDRLQGSCCSAMDFHRYTEQVEGLKKYSHINKIPSDPYDIEYNFNAEQIAEVWDLEDGCGGSGHVEGMHHT